MCAKASRDANATGRDIKRLRQKNIRPAESTEVRFENHDNNGKLIDRLTPICASAPTACSSFSTFKSPASPPQAIQP